MNEDKQLELPIPQPRPRVRLGPDDLPAARTRWELYEDPPMPGWWEVGPFTPSVNQGTWWWDGIEWRRPSSTPDMRPPVRLSGDEFRKQYVWRGLKEPAPDVYPCPPYNSQLLMIAAQRAGVGLRTMFAVITPRRRTRNRLE